VDQARLERIEEENLRLRTAAEQALLFVEEVQGRVQVGEGFEVKTLITTLGEALERPPD
jgi:hypothetical protein